MKSLLESRHFCPRYHGRTERTGKINRSQLARRGESLRLKQACGRNRGRISRQVSQEVSSDKQEILSIQDSIDMIIKETAAPDS